MALRVKGAAYVGRAYIRDQHLLGALDDLASQIQFTRTNINSSSNGVVTPPAAPVAVNVAGGGGFATVSIAHPNPEGVSFVLEYDTTPSFPAPMRVDLGISQTWQQYLSGKTLYFRSASKFYTSGMSAWTYYGGLGSPKSMTF
jgi:hypothetical protein